MKEFALNDCIVAELEPEQAVVRREFVTALRSHPLTLALAKYAVEALLRHRQCGASELDLAAWLEGLESEWRERNAQGWPTEFGLALIATEYGCATATEVAKRADQAMIDWMLEGRADV